MERALSAAGKLFLAGEYSVLWGGRALVAAVGPRTSALVRRRSDREVHLVLEHARLIGRATPIGVNWNGPVPEAFRFAARSVDLSLRAHGKETLGFELALSASPVGSAGQKLGVGSSARACVLAAEAARYVLEGRYDALRLALLAHWGAQDGAGSGADVAASFAGGVIRYRRYPVDALREASKAGQLGSALLGAGAVDIWRLPLRPLYLTYVFSGESASTPALIASAETRLDDAARAEIVSESEAFCDVLERGLIEGQFGLVVEAVRGLREVLNRVGRVETEAVKRIVSIAETYGCAAKISGAGGGDGCIVFSVDEKTQSDLVTGLEARGFSCRELEIEPGLRGESAPDPTLERWLRT